MGEGEGRLRLTHLLLRCLHARLQPLLLTPHQRHHRLTFVLGHLLLTAVKFLLGSRPQPPLRLQLRLVLDDPCLEAPHPPPHFLPHTVGAQVGNVKYLRRIHQQQCVVPGEQRAVRRQLQ